ncbi:hypothetical protein NLI96_g3205 [Meripilus lineatus]|uniref:Ubiquitin carboxyl-terminal hydrolase n=1 Tax=Meripilus lineatus TaxID=2056292 RepID=A0AAD5YFU7_9APHY|nr:hypothetical protein NLI96_g3205 [Physisporinus lineatus]
MSPLAVHIKHAGKVHNVELNTDLPPGAFKEAIYQVTGVPPERMKVMIKGGMLKDDTDWRKVAPKAGQTFMVIGAAGELPKPPEKPVLFLEDMDDSELAQVLALPVGLENLGNTCYMNATVQAMRAIPELQTALQAAPSLTGIPSGLKNLYVQMAHTTESVQPQPFLQALRTAFPQFAELQRGGGFAMKGMSMPRYAQQDAEECWVQMTNSLKDVPGLPGPSGSAPTKNFVEQYMTGELRRELKCRDAPEEPPSVTFEKVLKIECNITIQTNYLHSGVMDASALNVEIEKNSPSLGREAIYDSTSRLSRLPSYLTVHMVRFAWRRDIGKKAKIMRKVKFQTELDALDWVTDELKAKLTPVSRRLKELEKERFERVKIRRRTKNAVASSEKKDKDKDVEMADAHATASSSSDPVPDGETAEGKGKEVAGGELEDEWVYREKESKELEELIHPDLKADTGCSVSGLYELVAIVTHKGAAADAGHYMGYVKRSVFHPITYARPSDGAEAEGTSSTGNGKAKETAALAEGDDDWYKFDDDKVSVFPVEKLATLDGGGEDSSAYVLLYRTKKLA